MNKIKEEVLEEKGLNQESPELDDKYGLNQESPALDDKYGLNQESPELDDEEGLNPNNLTEFTIENIFVERAYFSIFELKRKYDRLNNLRQSKENYIKENFANQLILDSDFQREEVWYKKQKSELIESVLMGLPLPTIYLSEDSNANLIVVDGRQRLTAFFEYIDNKFALSELSILSDLGGKKFDDLDPILQAKLEDYQIIVQVIKPPTSDSVKFQIFDRVNRGGTPLNNQEMRNALYQGNATKLLETLSKSNEFKSATYNGISSKRMKDRYIILRTLAFYLLNKNKLYDKKKNLINYKGNIDEFLGITMEYLNNEEIEELKRLEKEFLDAMKIVPKTLNKDAFRVVNSDNINERRPPINMALFETWTYLLMDSLELNVSCEFYKEEYSKLMRNQDFLESIVNNRDSSSKVEERYKIIKEILNKGVK